MMQSLSGPPLQVTEMEEREEDVLLPCQFCLELFSISIFESHQEHCMNRDDASSHFPATSSLYGEPFSTPPSSPPSATSYHSTSQLVNSTPPPPFILTPPATPQRTANTQPNNVHSLPSHATNGPSTLERGMLYYNRSIGPAKMFYHYMYKYRILY